MRVIAGQFRGRPLKTPEGLATRPILDRVKGALFDWLGSRLALPGHLPPVNVCDLFCGAGSQGIEALSRGAAYCTFVESDPQAFRCLRDNIAAFRLSGNVTLLMRPAEGLTLAPINGRGFSILFLDPPFPLSGVITPDSVMGKVIARLGHQIPMEPDAIVLWRHDTALELPARLPGGWESRERRAWGTNAITLLSRPRAEHE